MTQPQVHQTNWLAVIKAKQVKDEKLKAAQLCTAGHCPAKVK
ncbi:hypothetical protein R1080702_231 [Cyanophage S-RIM32]|uniref:Uncharacterized protein n=1 Tax=Cyanophage S-RIM32 TaxID=1278479 RepID=A0A127KMU5_9CAUD|nr:hypothetical protein BJD26_gp029 [Cyanophage S-RIM32]AMO43236.1 hypothetical protein R1080702_231 [Cyanophage S-RIM32]